MSAHDQLALFKNMRNIFDMLESNLGKDIPDYENMPYAEYMEKCMEDMKREAQQYFAELQDAKAKMAAMERLIVTLSDQVADLQKENDLLRHNVQITTLAMRNLRPSE